MIKRTYNNGFKIKAYYLFNDYFVLDENEEKELSIKARYLNLMKGRNKKQWKN